MVPNESIGMAINIAMTHIATQEQLNGKVVN